MKYFSVYLFSLAGVGTQPVGNDALAKVWKKWYEASWFPLSNDGPAGLEPNFLFCAVVSALVFLYVAELGTRFLDAPSVRLSRWVYLRFLKAD